MSGYSEEEYLQLSGIQHFVFCPRQWALIHIEQQWADNVRTVDGNIFHERTHSEELTEKRGDLIVTRGMRIQSGRLGCDRAVRCRGVPPLHRRYNASWPKRQMAAVSD